METTDKTYELFTLRQGGKGQAGHWNKTQASPYGNREEDSIEESNSQTTTEPTSIPSPFARMELARTAFAITAEILNKQVKDDNGNNRDATWDDVPRRYRKIVSDCLDVAEIFFNYPMYKKDIQIIKWSVDLLKEKPLCDSPMGKAMSKFLAGDGAIYNFDRMDAIYLLNYVGKDRPDKVGLNIIGATSPITLFFSIDNDLSYVSKHIPFTNGDKPFDGDFNPLENRDPSFIKYLKLLIDNYGKEDFARDFKAVHDYIITACNNVSDDINLSGSYDYQNIEIEEGKAEFVSVLGHFIGCQAERQPENSDFEIKSTLVTSGRLPLVLPVDSANGFEKCAYINIHDLWRDKVAPVVETRQLEDRYLPGTGVPYPYLTVSDFFEDTIIKMPYKLNSAAYFNGNIRSETDESYLLPLTSTFFKYFTVDELKSMIKMEVSGTVVKVMLNIPIQNYSKKATVPYITYTKTYQANKNVGNHIGDTTSAKFGFGIFPIVRPNDVNVAHYRVALFDKAPDISLKFFDKTEQIIETYSKVRREFGAACGIKAYVIEKRNFDRVDVVVGDNHGYIIPNFETTEGTNKYRFAVDFGTTNTHIAYSISNQRQASAFDCPKPQIARLHENYKDARDIMAAFEDNFVPTGFGSTKLAFPLRSAFAEAQHIDYGQITYTLCDGNIPFPYEQVGPRDYLDVQTGDDLKWSANKGRIELYIRNIAFILHNKVLLEKGSLKDTEIRWFSPASMSTFVRNMMEQAWIRAYKDFFDADYNPDSNKVTSMSESIAPYCYYTNRDAAVGIVTTIDVGGGTTDVYVSDGRLRDGANNDGLLLSFRCASNAIFGDGYNNNIGNNGFVRKYRMLFEEQLANDDTLSNALNTIALKGKSSELISFFFSLAATRRPGLDFMQKLAEDQVFKYVFLVFYSSIIYHVAQTMKAKGIGKPQTVAFSGNGSRTLQVISQNHDIQEEFVKTIFENVYGEKYPAGQRFYLKFDNDKPKEATANGGLEATPEQIAAKPELVVMLGNDNKTLAAGEKFEQLSDAVKKGVVKSVSDFVDFIPSLNINNAFGDKYSLNVGILNDVLAICKQNLDNYLELGVQKVLSILSTDPTQTNNVTESLFFFPVVGMLNNLAQELYDIDVNN